MTHEQKAIIERHIDSMFEELGLLDNPHGWIPPNANKIVTESVAAVLDYAVDVEKYMEKEGMLK